MSTLILTPDELVALTDRRQPSAQLAALHRMGFWRARRSPTGRVILERVHYEAVGKGQEQSPRPKVRPPVPRMA